MSSMSLAIAGNAAGRLRATYPGPEFVLPHADPRALGLTRPLAESPPPSGADLMTLSESVRDRVSLSPRVRQSPDVEKAARRKHSPARPAGRDDASQSLSEMADAVADRVSLTRRSAAPPTPETTYSIRGTRVAEETGTPVPELERMAAGITDQVTLTGGNPGKSSQPDEITVYIAGSVSDAPEHPLAGGFVGLGIVPAAV